MVAQVPRLAPHLPEMRENLAKVFDTQAGRINIKATTSEGLGFCGQKGGDGSLCRGKPDSGDKAAGQIFSTPTGIFNRCSFIRFSSPLRFIIKKPLNKGDSSAF